jgi:hypothetical protein
MTDYLKVKDHPSLVRDKKSNAILNTDQIALNKYKEERERLLKIKNSVDDTEMLKRDMVQTKQDINEIKQMLIKLMEKN